MGQDAASERHHCRNTNVASNWVASWREPPQDHNNKVLRHLLCIFIFTSLISYGQNKSLTLGHRHSGISIGNSERNNGIRINFIDKRVSQINGINISGLTKTTLTNGLSIGIASSQDEVCNGLVINGLLAEMSKVNGFVVSGLGGAVNKINGIGVGGLSITGDSLNGLFISSIGVTYWNTDQIKQINGVTIGILVGANAENMNGLSIGLFQNVINHHNGVMIAAVNRTKELHGFQFGLLNYAGNNRKLFRWTPILNFNLKRKASTRRQTNKTELN